MLLDADILWTQGGGKYHAKFALDTGVTALIGPSGAGKTSLARMIAGLDRPDGGHIRFADTVFYHRQKEAFVPPANRSIALVAQDPALFPHLSVRENIGFADSSSAETRQAAIGTMGCERLLDRNPTTLSGGEKRRVAIARALASRPNLLILDEPMTGLDPKARMEILPYIKRLNREDAVPVLIITHHLEDMIAVADHAMLMGGGRIVAAGSLEDVIREPECAELLGITDAGHLLYGTATGQQNSMVEIDLGGETLIVSRHDPVPLNASMFLRIFSTDISLSRRKIEDISVLNQLDATIVDIDMQEAYAVVTLQLAKSGLQLQSRVTHHTVNRMELATGQSVVALIKAVSVKDVVSEASSA